MTDFDDLLTETVAIYRATNASGDLGAAQQGAFTQHPAVSQESVVQGLSSSQSPAAVHSGVYSQHPCNEQLS